MMQEGEYGSVKAGFLQDRVIWIDKADSCREGSNADHGATD